MGFGNHGRLWALWGGGLAGYVVPFLFVLTIVVFFHELGHFLVARWCGIKVLVFSIGFGPEIVGFNDRHGTRWKISAIPLGGYVKFFGDDNAASVPDQAAAAAMTEAEKTGQLHLSSRSARAPRSSRPGRSPISSWRSSIFAGIFMIVGKQTTSARVDTVQPGSAAQPPASSPATWCSRSTASKIESFSDMQRIVSISAGRAADHRGRPRRRAGHAQGHARS